MQFSKLTKSISLIIQFDDCPFIYHIQLLFYYSLIIVIDISSDCDFCPDTIYSPVCGTDRISYYNDCELRKYACYINDMTLQVAHGGVCRELPPPPPVSPGKCYDG